MTENFRPQSKQLLTCEWHDQVSAASVGQGFLAFWHKKTFLEGGSG